MYRRVSWKKMVWRKCSGNWLTKCVRVLFLAEQSSSPGCMAVTELTRGMNLRLLPVGIIEEAFEALTG
jgi:hypothetical protein